MKKILLISLMLVLFLVGCNSNENLENNNILDNSVEQNQEQIQGTINENEKIKSLLVNGSGWNPVSAYDLINNKESDLFEVYGSGIHYGGTLDFKEDGTFTKTIGVYAENYMGEYEIDVDKNVIYFTFETGMKMEGSYQYVDGEITSIYIIEGSDDWKYRVTLIKKDKIASDDNNENVAINQEYNQELKIYENKLDENLLVLTDYTTDFFNYENLEIAQFLNSKYDVGRECVSQYIKESETYANENTDSNVIVYISFSEISQHDDYYLYVGRFVSNKNLSDLEEKIVKFMRSGYAHEPMNEKTPRYDTEDVYNLALSESEETFEVLASGKILSINVNDETDISRLYPGEI